MFWNLKKMYPGCLLEIGWAGFVGISVQVCVCGCGAVWCGSDIAVHRAMRVSVWSWAQSSMSSASSAEASWRRHRARLLPSLLRRQRRCRCHSGSDLPCRQPAVQPQSTNAFGMSVSYEHTQPFNGPLSSQQGPLRYKIRSCIRSLITSSTSSAVSYTHTHNCLTAFCVGLSRCASTRRNIYPLTTMRRKKKDSHRQHCVYSHIKLKVTWTWLQGMLSAGWNWIFPTTQSIYSESRATQLQQICLTQSLDSISVEV